MNRDPMPTGQNLFLQSLSSLLPSPAADAAALHAMSPSALAPLQQRALTERLAKLLPALPSLNALAEAQGLGADIALDDAPRLFFPHSIYKSYNPAWLLDLDFARMGRWLQKFTTVDLRLGEALEFANIDTWLTWLEDECGLDIAHSSGTTGRMSLIARAKEDAAARHARNRVGFVDLMKRRGMAEDDMWYHIVWPGAAGGRSAQQKMADGARVMSAKSPEDFVALYDDDLGADYELYVVRARLARERGQLDLPPPSLYVESRLAEANRRHAEHALYQERMLDRIADLRGQRVMMMGSPHSLAAIARASMVRGDGGNFAPNSAHITVGGLKGLQEPPDFAATLERFLGPSIPVEGYGATEMNTGYLKCLAGRFHIPPWVVAWALDPTAGWQPRPREGKQEGRGAFLDLAFESAWGGLVTADHIEIDYQPCTCGRASPSIGPLIRRVMDRDGDFGWIPAAPGAIYAALEVLNGVN